MLFALLISNEYQGAILPKGCLKSLSWGTCSWQVGVKAQPSTFEQGVLQGLYVLQGLVFCAAQLCFRSLHRPNRKFPLNLQCLRRGSHVTQRFLICSTMRWRRRRIQAWRGTEPSNQNASRAAEIVSASLMSAFISLSSSGSERSVSPEST